MQDTQDDTTGTYRTEGELGAGDTKEMPTISSNSDSEGDDS